LHLDQQSDERKIMSDVECPYCGQGVEINHDDGYGCAEDELHHQECSSCEKIFTFYTQINLTYNAYKADCLNGGEHIWQKTNTYPPEFARLKCKTCDEYKPIPKEKL